MAFAPKLAKNAHHNIPSGKKENRVVKKTKPRKPGNIRRERRVKLTFIFSPVKFEHEFVNRDLVGHIEVLKKEINLKSNQKNFRPQACHSAEASPLRLIRLKSNLCHQRRSDLLVDVRHRGEHSLAVVHILDLVS